MGKPGFPIPLLEGGALPHPPAGGGVEKPGFPTSLRMRAEGLRTRRRCPAPDRGRGWEPAVASVPEHLRWGRKYGSSPAGGRLGGDLNAPPALM